MANCLLFSKFSDEEFSSICEILCAVFSTSKAELSSLYKNLSDDFNKEELQDSHSVSRHFFRSGKSAFQAVCDSSPVVGVDLPSTLELDDSRSTKPTIFIIGQDPKRDRDEHEIGIGTPYALHLRSCREELRRTKLYFNMVEVLLELGYRVYLTDIFKVWICNPARPYFGLSLPKIDKEKFQRTLSLEVEVIQPIALVTWGKKAEYSLSALKFDIPHFKFPHPSGAAGKTWKELVNKPITDSKKVEYWRSEIQSFLSIHSVTSNS